MSLDGTSDVLLLSVTQAQLPTTHAVSLLSTFPSSHLASDDDLASLLPNQHPTRPPPSRSAPPTIPLGPSAALLPHSSATPKVSRLPEDVDRVAVPEGGAEGLALACPLISLFHTHTHTDPLSPLQAAVVSAGLPWSMLGT